MVNIRLLLIEDNYDFCQVVKDSLELTGDYEVFTASNGAKGYEAYKTIKPDIIVSDIDMPEMSGIEMVELIKKYDDITPIVFASALVQPRDLVKGYKLNIDEYIKKPFLPAELDLHIKAILRRTNKSTTIKQEESPIYMIGQYQFNYSTYTLSKDEEDHRLSLRQSQILQMLCDNRGAVVKRDDILQRFWGNNDFYTSRSLDVFISNLRRLLENDTSVQIFTIRGEGFRLIY